MKILFSKYGEVLDVFMKQPEEKNLNYLPSEKKEFVMNHQFAFITFKEFASADLAVNEVPYLKIRDEDYNKEIEVVAEEVKKHTNVEDK